MHQQRPVFPRPESPNAHAAMLGQAIARNAARVFVRLPAWVTVGWQDSSEHVAFVRDISSRGIFFYSDWKPAQGEQLDFLLQYLSGNNRIRLHLSGTVVRVESGSAKSACGIAIAFDTPREEFSRFSLRRR